ncbi:MAG: hypothetical protein QOH40_971 [Arthrobacter pascens]|jgi:hypothetical protein|nr:hypothetical protein [Arthrobacter pascens]
MRHEDLRLMIETRWPGAPVASTRQLAAAGLEDRTLTAAVRDDVLLRLRENALAVTCRSGRALHERP